MRRSLCRHALSPLLRGPFLISPGYRQSATPGSNQLPPGYQITETPPIRNPSLPQGHLRGEVPARDSLRDSRVNNTTPPSIPPAGLLATGFCCISTHRVSIRPFHPSLDAVSRPAPTLDILWNRTLQSTCRPDPPQGVLSSVSRSYSRGLILPPLAAAYLPPLVHRVHFQQLLE